MSSLENPSKEQPLYNNRHISNNNLIEPHQAAHWPSHSTEMALLEVKTYLIMAIENQEIVCLVLLDLGAAFDTVDSGILLQRLTNLFGITGTFKTWIASYLIDQTEKVKVGSSESSMVTLKYGVPQGSVLGPILFILYTTPLGQICRKDGIHYHLHADDSQLQTFSARIKRNLHTMIGRMQIRYKNLDG